MVIFEENPGEISEELPCEIFWKSSIQFMGNLIKKIRKIPGEIIPENLKNLKIQLLQDF